MNRSPISRTKHTPVVRAVDALWKLGRSVVSGEVLIRIHVCTHALRITKTCEKSELTRPRWGCMLCVPGDRWCSVARWGAGS